MRAQSQGAAACRRKDSGLSLEALYRIPEEVPV